MRKLLCCLLVSVFSACSDSSDAEGVYDCEDAEVTPVSDLVMSSASIELQRALWIYDHLPSELSLRLNCYDFVDRKVVISIVVPEKETLEVISGKPQVWQEGDLFICESVVRSSFKNPIILKVESSDDLEIQPSSISSRLLASTDDASIHGRDMGISLDFVVQDEQITFASGGIGIQEKNGDVKTCRLEAL